MAWRLEGAACGDLTPDEADQIFFSVGRPTKARVMCTSCPVQPECLADVLAAEGRIPLDFRLGFRAGLTTAERVALQRGLSVVA